MTALLLRRVGLLVLVLFIVSVLTFCIVNVLPGDVAQAILGDLGTPEQVVALRERMGLNLPLVQRYQHWIGGLLQGDLGTSLTYQQPIAGMLFGRLGNSAILAGITLAIAAPLAIGIGVVAALKPGGWVDRVISGLAVLCFSLPEYVTGLTAILVFSILWPVLPGSSLMEPDANPLSHPEALVLPVAVLVLGMLAHLSQITRGGMIVALDSAYVRTAVLKGLPGWVVVLKHALPNVMLPTLTEIGMHIGYLLGGIVVVETLFAYAGVGEMLVNAVSHRDIPVVQITVLVVALAYGVGNLLADVACILLDPRLRNQS
ncbi:ABC transporter permease [Humitalea sp. 24SJ18S-53]|uniref:ABC transporter permease n=1 Tax=Humitalea sp. 24SJ18S-53 TaxID=3422307 RepID=UPI003D678F98